MNSGSCSQMTASYKCPESFSLFFLMKVRVIVIETSLGLPNFNMKEKRNEFW